MRNKFDEQLERLHIELIKMGALCEEAVTTAIESLEKNDSTTLNKVFEIDGEIDQAERSPTWKELEIRHLILRKYPELS